MGLNIAIDVERTEWKVLGDYDERFRGINVKLKSTECKAYRRRQEQLSRLKPKQLRKGWSGTEAALANVRSVTACLEDWKGVEDAGTAIAFDRTMAEEWADDPDGAFLPFFQAVYQAATEMAEADREGEDESLGNSEPPSTG